MESNQFREPWNKGKLVGQKAPLKPKDIWAIRIHLQNACEVRDLAMFNLAIDSKLRGCDLVSLRVRDVTHGNQVLFRAMVVQRKTQRPVQFELTEPTRTAVTAWIAMAGCLESPPGRLRSCDILTADEVRPLLERVRTTWCLRYGRAPGAARQAQRTVPPEMSVLSCFCQVPDGVAGTKPPMSVGRCAERHRQRSCRYRRQVRKR